MIFTDQEGIMWDAAYAVCPSCQAPSDFDNSVPGSGYFRCACGVIYDEPEFTNPEAAYMGESDDL